MPEPSVLVVNSGSSSLKYRLSAGDRVITGGVVEHIGESGGPAGHTDAWATVVRGLPEAQLAGIGHRVVHGGSRVTQPVLVDADVEAVIEEMTPFAPVHNPPALAVIRAAARQFPEVPQVAVFDTAFHATLPPVAFTYAIDTTVAARHGIRRFGFHGISVEHAVSAAAELIGSAPSEPNLIVAHLGNGASVTAVASGRSIDTSMGMTPLEGLIMGTRSGDLDPSIGFHLQRSGLGAEAVEQLYEHGSGLRGLAGDNDMRALLTRADAGDETARLAIEMYCYRLRKYIGAYAAVLGSVDGVVFTGGVGENAAAIRMRTLAGLSSMGVDLDPRANAEGVGARVISAPESRVRVCIVPADEESVIARHTLRLINAGGGVTEPASPQSRHR
jgi:acetate kinase